jgi:hypothetical protein
VCIESGDRIAPAVSQTDTENACPLDVYREIDGELLNNFVDRGIGQKPPLSR